MKKSVSVLLVSVLMSLLFASSALAHEGHEHTEATTVMTTVMASGSAPVGTLSASGGPSILLPAAALLLGMGVLSYAVLQRRT